MKSNLRAIDCAMDGCRCGTLHPAFRDCPTCKGVGMFMGGDELHPCPGCRLRFNGLPAALSVSGGRSLEQVIADNARLDAQERELDLAKETALD